MHVLEVEINKYLLKQLISRVYILGVASVILDKQNERFAPDWKSTSEL